MENLRLHRAASISVNVTVGKRSREYLTEREVERLIEAAKQNRSGHRDEPHNKNKRNLGVPKADRGEQAAVQQCPQCPVSDDRPEKVGLS